MAALNYGTLKSQILEDSHRADLSSKVDDFVRQAEGIIYRTLRAAEMITRVDLTDADRVTAGEGIYTLPTDFLEDRAAFLINTTSGDIALERVSLAELRRFAGSTTVRHYSILSSTEIEFRGIPSADEDVELIYYARPAAFSADADTNDILTYHEALYLHASLSMLYTYTQDLELAQAHGQIALDVVEDLNEQAGRMIGGTNTAGYYDLSSWGPR